MIDKGKISQEPFIEILKILEEAETANLVDWNAMNIASVDQMNQPSSRMVLLKKISDEFWQERDNRTHERLKYILSDNQKWSSHLLSP